MDVTVIVLILTTVLGAASTVLVAFKKYKVSNFLKAVVLGIQTFSDKYQDVGEEIKEEIKAKAEELGVEKPLKKEVDKIKEV